MRSLLQPGCQPGKLTTYETFEETVKSAWLVVECIPEKLPIKIDLFGKLDALVDEDTILASNSSSFRSSEMVGKVKHRHRGKSHGWEPAAGKGTDVCVVCSAERPCFLAA